MKNVTVSMDDAVAEWARLEAARRNTSVSRLLGELLQEAAAQRERAWLLADYERPACLQGVDLQAEIDLGD